MKKRPSYAFPISRQVKVEKGIPKEGRAKEVWDTLVKLGGSAYEVADNLYAMGYSGCHLATNCPVANYVADRVLTKVPVPFTSTQFMVDGRRWSVPAPVSEFILMFDGDLFPQLKDYATSDQ